MASRFEPSLRELALEPDDDRRLEMAAEIDRDVAELDERWDNRDGYARIEAERDEMAAERDAAIAERDDWKKRYADRFFDKGESDDATPYADNEERPKGYDALWGEE